MILRNPQEHAVTVEICNPRTGAVDHMQVQGRSSVETPSGWCLTDAFRKKNPWIVEAPGTPVRVRPDTSTVTAPAVMANQVDPTALINPVSPPVVPTPSATTKSSSKK